MMNLIYTCFPDKCRIEFERHWLYYSNPPKATLAFAFAPPIKSVGTEPTSICFVSNPLQQMLLLKSGRHQGRSSTWCVKSNIRMLSESCSFMSFRCEAVTLLHVVKRCPTSSFREYSTHPMIVWHPPETSQPSDTLAILVWQTLRPAGIEPRIPVVFPLLHRLYVAGRPFQLG